MSTLSRGYRAHSNPKPPLSIIIATTQPWPEVSVVLDSIYEQAAAVQAEIIVAESSGQGAPPDERYSGVHWINVLGATVFQLRARAIAASQGQIIAVTEDHCRVSPDWCLSILQSHQDYPQADMIGGSVENGADQHLIDWANFLISNDIFLPPLATGERPFITGQANVTYKRRALPNPYPIDIDEGQFRQALQQRGGKLYIDERLRVSHIQSLGGLGSCLIHFHDARTLSASQRSRMSPAQWLLRLLKTLLLPLRVVINTPRIVLRTTWCKPAYRRPALLCLPWIAMILCFHYSGELIWTSGRTRK